MRTKFYFLLRIFCFALVLSTIPKWAFAHATPMQYIPAASSVLAQTPAEVRIHFSERVEPRVSSVVVLAPDGSRADLPSSVPYSVAGSATDAADPRVLRVTVKDRGPGTYTVSWEVISADDGHFAKGAYVFSVGLGKPGAPTDSGGFQTVHSSGVPEACTLALELIGDALVLGALIAFAFLWRPMRTYFPEVMSEEPRFLRRFNFLFVVGCVLAILGGLAYLLYKTSELAALQQTTFASVWTPFLSTVSAISTIYRMLGAGFLLAAFAAMRKRIFSAGRTTLIEYVFFIVLALIDLARAQISHAAASNVAPGFGVAMNFVHLFFKDVWIGGIVALVMLFSPVVRRAKDLRIAAFALTAFSRFASVALGVAGVTGAYVVWLHLKSFSFVLTTDWGKRFALLSVFAGVLLLARLFDQLYCEPKIIGAIRTKDESQLPRVFSWLGLALPMELSTGIAILAVTSVLIITTPPLVPHYSFQRSVLSQGLEITLAEQPYESGKFLLTVEDASTKSAADVKHVAVSLTNRAAGIGPITASVEQRFARGYVFDENLLAPAGLWTINVSAQRFAAYDADALFDVDFPREITESDRHSRDRTFGLFETIHIFAALILLGASILLYRRSSKGNRFACSAPAATSAKTELIFARRSAWIPGALLIAIVLFLAGGFPALFPGVLEGSFQRSCEESNIMNVWHESVPEREGKATSDLAMPGCTTGIGLGQFHFVDAREFAYFIRPARAKAQLAMSPSAVEPGTPTLLTFTLRDLQGHPVQDLVLDHNRIVHVVIVSEDFSVFAHIHAEDFAPVTPEMLQAAEFPVRYTFPKPGRYLVSVDFMERGYSFSNQFYLNAGQPSGLAATSSGKFSSEAAFGGYDVTLKTSPATLKAGAPATLLYRMEKNGKPATDLNPYLAVPMHLSIIREDLMSFLHIHGLLPVSRIGRLLGENIHASHLLLPDKFGPNIEVTNFSFPSAGVYHIFGEFSVAGKVVVTQFAVKVE